MKDDGDRAAKSRLALASGREIEVSTADEGDWLTVRSREGACVLTVLLTDAGPVLRFEGAALQVAATKSVEISCEDFRVKARNELSLAGRAVDVRAHLGGVTVRADDDVAIDGERVLLNTSDGPEQLSWDEFLKAPRLSGKEP